MAFHLFPLLLLLSVLPFSSPISISPKTLANAVESLSAAGYVSMALTLSLISQKFLPPATARATLFSPSDAAFADYGQPPLSLLRFHLAPQRLRPKTLRSLSHGTKIPTLAPDLSLLITTSATEGCVSLNGVYINESALFDDASLIVYAADNCFDPSFRISSLSAQSLATPGSVIQCQPPNPNRSLTGTLAKLRSMGYSSITAFLDVQLEWGGSKGVTMFMPVDTTKEHTAADEMPISASQPGLVPRHEPILGLSASMIGIKIFSNGEGSKEEGRRARRGGKRGGEVE